jgi:tetratricopeptide (TPR) repeat protein
MARLAEDLSVQQRRLALLHADDLSVSSAFDATYAALPPDIARSYRVLAAIPGPDFGLGAAAACIGRDVGTAGDMLHALTTASLLQETGDDQFRYHDLIKLHALAQGRSQPDSELRNAAARAIRWYLEQTVAADLVVNAGRWRLNSMYEQARTQAPAFAGPAEALAWLESEQDRLCAAVAAAYDLSLHDLAWQLCEALWGLFSNRNYFRPWIETHLTGIAAARAAGSRRGEARMRMQLGLAFRHLHRFDDAREQYALALILDQAEGHRVGEATELEQLGLTDLAEGHPETAIQAFSRAEGIFREIGMPRGAAMMICHIGEAHRDAGRYLEAIQKLTAARRMFASLPDRYNEARALAELGRACLHTAEPGEAEQLLASALEAMIALDSPYEQARIRVALADAAARRGDAEGAHLHLVTALAVYDALGAPEARQVRAALRQPDVPSHGPASDDVQ